MTEYIDATKGCRVTATYQDLHVQCPYDDHTDNYTITITWTTNEKSLEYQYLNNLIRTYQNTEISHEQLATKLQDSIDYPVTVTVTGEHYGLEVTVTT